MRTGVSSGEYAAPNEIWIPHWGAIIDFKDCVAYIQDNPALSVVSNIMGLQKFLLWANDNYVFMDLYQETDFIFVLDDSEYEFLAEISQADVISELLHYRIFKNTAIKKQLQKEYQCDEIDFFGCGISRWLSPTQALVESHQGEILPTTHRRASFYAKISKPLGSHIGFIGYPKTVQDSSGIRSDP